MKEETAAPAPEPFVPQIEEGPYVDSERTIPDFLDAPTPSEGPTDGIKVGERIELPPEEPSTPAEPKVETEESGTCKHCNRRIDQVRSEMQPTDDDKRRFRRYVQGEPRFQKEYVLMSGTVRVSFRSRHTRETEAIFATLTDLLAKNELGPGPAYGNPAYHLRMDRFLLAATLDKVTLESQEGSPARVLTFEPLTQSTQAPRPTSEQVCAMEEAAIQKLDNEALFAMLLGRLRHFEQTFVALVQRSNDPDFWAATAGTR